MKKNDVINRIKQTGVVAVVRAESKDQATKISQACIKGGITAIEITFTVPKAEDVIKALGAELGDQLLIGAGTVLDLDTTKLAIENGAKFIVSPGFDEESAIYCKKLGIPYIPGCMTITEMLHALKYGVDIIKLFPGSVFGPDFVKSIKGPLPNVQIMPTGGVDLRNVEDWIHNGCVAVGIGSKLTAPAKQEDYEGVTELAKLFTSKVNDARDKAKGN